MAQAVAKELKAVIKPEEKNLIEKIPSENLEAYDYYLPGVHLRGQRTPESLLKGKTMFERAIGADPGFAKAYTGLAHCYGTLAFYANLSPAEAYPPAEGLAYSKSGALHETRRMLDTLIERDRTGFVPQSMIGSLMAETGRNREALD